MTDWLSTKEVAAIEGRSERAIQKDAKEKKYPLTKRGHGKGRGGRPYLIHKSCLTPPQEPPTFQLTQEVLPPPQTQPFGNFSEDALLDPKIQFKIQVAREALNPPVGVSLTQNKEAVALKYSKAKRTVDYWCSTLREKGPEGFIHRKSNRDEPRAWEPKEALDFWVGLCLKKSHRKLDKKSLYEALCVEAQRRGWRIGSYSDALWWLKKKITPQLKAIQKGGVRALDNILPPVVRDYSDLAPFEILVGDQHRFDFWVVDDETGIIFRPEGYYWQDLRTRIIYGGAFAKHYEAYTIGLALRMGMKVFGPFGSIYTDHGKPEESKYIMGVLKEMRTLGLEAAQTEDIYAELDGADPEELHCMIHLPGSHTRAIVRNAKAKMIESTNAAIEKIIRNVFKAPGSVKDIKASQEEQEVDHKEIERLAAVGKLLTFREFVLTVLKAMNYYNSQRPHRGVLKEWAWVPKPKEATPIDCLAQCCRAGEWQPTWISEPLNDLVFLRRAERVIDRGRLTVNGISYEAGTEVGMYELAGLTGKRVSIRHEHPMDTSYILVFHDNNFICECRPTEFSSMKNKKLASRKIEQKRALRRQFLEQYRELTSKVPDFIQYSKVPKAERTAALVHTKRKRHAAQEAERLRPRTQEELDAAMEAYERYEQEAKDRRPIFGSDGDRYNWILGQQIDGRAISEEDAAFLVQYEASMHPDMLAFWQEYKREQGLLPVAEEGS